MDLFVSISKARHISTVNICACSTVRYTFSKIRGKRLLSTFSKITDDKLFEPGSGFDFIQCFLLPRSINGRVCTDIVTLEKVWNKML